MMGRMELIRRPAALAGGYSDRELQRCVSRGTWRRIRPGHYVPEDAMGHLADAAQHRLAVAAALQAHRPGTVASHSSAAACLGIPLWGLDIRRVNLTRAGTSGGRTNQVVRLHVCPLPAPDVVTLGNWADLDPLQATSPARTVADIARGTTHPVAVAVADAMMRKYRLTQADITSVLDRMPRWPGVRAARRAVAFADPRSESVGESRSRVVLAAAGLPAPELQYDVYTSDRFLGRADFAYPDLGVLGEFDGRVKYGELRAPGQDPADVLFAEKQREDALRDAGWQVVRWTWADLGTPHAIRERFARAFRRAGH